MDRIREDRHLVSEEAHSHGNVEIPVIRESADKQLELLLSDQCHSLFNIKKMNDQRNIWEGRVTASYRNLPILTDTLKNNIQ